jgi:hypothetical protein
MTNIQLALYGAFLERMAGGLVDWSGNPALTVTLHTSTYTPNRDTHTVVSDLSNELPTAAGYTIGGVALTGATITRTLANSWGTTWAAGATTLAGQIIRPTVGNGLVYQAAVAGVSAIAEPSWPTTPGVCVTDGTTQWVCVGRSFTSLDANNLTPGWASFSAGPFRHVVLSDRSPAGAGNQTLVGVWSYSTDQTGGGGDYTLTFDPAGLVLLPTA